MSARLALDCAKPVWEPGMRQTNAITTADTLVVLVMALKKGVPPPLGGGAPL